MNRSTSEVILLDKIKCSDDFNSTKYSNPREYNGTYNVRVFGTPTYNFSIEVNAENETLKYLQVDDIRI